MFHTFFGLTASVLRELSFTVVTGRAPLPTRPPETNHSLRPAPRPVTDLWLCGGVEVVHRADRGSSQRRLALRFLVGKMFGPGRLARLFEASWIELS